LQGKVDPPPPAVVTSSSHCTEVPNLLIYKPDVRNQRWLRTEGAWREKDGGTGEGEEGGGGSAVRERGPEKASAIGGRRS
jgi:hypothetical protein